MMMRGLILLGIAVVAVILGLASWESAGPADVSTAGYIAMAVGIVVTLLVGGGLMALVFYSARRGYDDQQRGAPPEEKRP